MPLPDPVRPARPVWWTRPSPRRSPTDANAGRPLYAACRPRQSALRRAFTPRGCPGDSASAVAVGDTPRRQNSCQGTFFCCVIRLSRSSPVQWKGFTEGAGQPLTEHLYVIRIPGDGTPRHRDRVLARLAAGVHYPAAVHRVPAFAHLDYPAGTLPHAEAAATSSSPF